MGSLAALLLSVAAASAPAAVPQDERCGEPAPAVATPGIDGKTCNSLDAYYGLGRTRDFQAARLCAYAEREDHDFFAVDGPGVLMMIYANGQGVPRDLGRARQFACEMGPDGLDSRLQRLEEMSAELAEHATPDPIDVCLHAVGAQTIACADLSSQQQALELDARYSELARGWPDEQRRALTTLHERASAYFADTVYAQGNLPGSYPAAMAMEESDQLEQALFARIVAASREAVPAASNEQAADADRELNAAYRAVLKVLRDREGNGKCVGPSVEPTEVRAVQRLWIAYRDAWVAFGMARHPGSLAAGWSTVLTGERAQELREFAHLADCDR